MIPPTLFAARLRQHALSTPASAAMATPGREVTYADLLGQVESCAVWLEELLACAREQPGVRAPRKITVLPALPRSAAGKILKPELVDLIALDR